MAWFLTLWYLARWAANRLPLSSPLLFSHLLSSIFLTLLALISLLVASTLVSLVLLAIVVGDYLWLRRARERIAFMSEELALIVRLCEVGSTSPAGGPARSSASAAKMMVVLLLASLTQAAFLLLWNAAVLPVLPLASSGAVVGMLICLLSFRWTTGVLKHIVTFVVSAYMTEAIKTIVLTNPEQPNRVRERLNSLTEDGAADVRGDDDDVQVHLAGSSPLHADTDGVTSAATNGNATPGHERHPFASPSRTSQEVRNRIIRSVGRAGTTDPLKLLAEAVTTSFGSICAGALMAFASPVVWACRRGARLAARASGRTFCGRCVAAVAARMYGILDGYLRLSHKYAYVFVSTHHVSWFDAAQSTWEQFHKRGVDAVIDDDVTDRMLLFGGYAGGAFLSLVLGTSIHTPFVSTWLLSMFIVFCMGFVAVSLPLTLWEASVSTLFVTYAQVPEAIAILHPLVAHRFSRLSEGYLLARAQTRIAHLPDAGDDL